MTGVLGVSAASAAMTTLNMQRSRSRSPPPAATGWSRLGSLVAIIVVLHSAVRCARAAEIDLTRARRSGRAAWIDSCAHPLTAVIRAVGAVARSRS